MVHDVVFSLWFLLPAAAANAAPVFSNIIPGFKNWQTPMDFGRTFRGKALLGKHKTWRGLVSGMAVATFELWLEQLLVRHFGWAQHIVEPVNYAAFPTLLLGPLFGIGALGGDAVESFFKRQRGIVSGGSWLPFDQLDYIIGSVLISLPFVILSIRQYILIFIIWFAMHMLATYVGWKMGLKERPI